MIDIFLSFLCFHFSKLSHVGEDWKTWVTSSRFWRISFPDQLYQSVCFSLLCMKLVLLKIQCTSVTGTNVHDMFGLSRTRGKEDREFSVICFLLTLNFKSLSDLSVGCIRKDRHKQHSKFSPFPVLEELKHHILNSYSTYLLPKAVWVKVPLRSLWNIKNASCSILREEYLL